MFDFDVSMVERFAFAQETAYVTLKAHICFHVRGLLWRRIDGVEQPGMGPHLSVIAAGTPVAFAYDETRENWVIQLETEEVRPTETTDEVEIRFEGAWIRTPAFAQVPREHVSGWQGEFLRMRDAFRDPHPRSRLRVRVGVGNAFRYLLDQQPDVLGETPAEHLKRLIAEDLRCTASLQQLSERCGYSADHLRTLFVRHYGLSPLAYRNRHRMARAVHLLGNSDLTVKEVAAETGFRHVSHFSTLFRTTFGTTPSEAIQRYRSGQPWRPDSAADAGSTNASPS